ncbi:MAG TPA: DNA-3-methyladenine glycosylase 2 [Usitatibacter sp.]|nr:DNA-3-methyladenine glycosylase 2 [Usitatibacter sp.]
MLLDADQCYRALRTHDARFDGRFFVGVETTRIYCRPVCSARTPHRENCRFFASAAAAESQGFRPCLRCRPEMAPGHAAVDAQRRLAQAAADLIDEGSLADAGLPELAAMLGVTDRHLRRVFQQEFGVAPVEYAQTQRLLLGKRLLTDTRMPVIEVALASGFSSLRRFNHLFRTRYRMTPMQLRQHAPERDARRGFRFELAYRPPYDWDAMLDFLARRAIEGLEAVQGREYRRSLRIERHGRVHAGIVSVSPMPRRAAARVVVSESLAGVLPAVLGRVKHLFDLSCHPEEVRATLGPLAANPGLRVPGCVDGFEIAVRAILGQQVTVRAGTVIARRFVERLGEALEGGGELQWLFPTPARVAGIAPDDVAACGIIASRARAIVAVASEIAAGRLSLERTAPVDDTIAALSALPGIGPWTAQYIAMRALGWPDAFPHPDVAAMKSMGLKSPAAALRMAEQWRPWRAYALIQLWSAKP